ncbi:ATP-binding protein [Streptomyces sp. NPDC001165]|uniref:ATP-binding protein n=1 Tax=Streptomyces sp. NPDC001165 TaxID=3364546 RepID=UPI00367AE768
MSEHTAQAQAPAVTRGRRRRAHADDSLRMPPAVTTTALTAVTLGGAWVLDSLGLMPTAANAVTAGTTVGGLLWWAATRSFSARRAVAHVDQLRAERDSAYEALSYVIAAIDKGREHVRWALGQTQQGEVRTDFRVPAEPARTGDVRADVIPALERGIAEAWQAVMTAAAHTHHMLNSQAELAEIFKSVAPRLQGLVNRGIHVISEVENSVEDPDLMHEMFRVDHLLTQIRRAVESLAVLGGSLPSRNSEPILVATAIRRAVAEIEEYARVRVTLTPVPVAVPGYVSPNLVHLLAALMENATTFSTDKVEVHTHQTDSGVAIEVIDRGTGMSPQKRDALNQLLASPEREDPRARLRAGQLGLLVAALLAKRHKITIRLGANIVGGTQAVVVLPHDLLVEVNDQPTPSTRAVENTASSPAPSSTPRAGAAFPAGPDGQPRRIPPVPAPNAQPHSPAAANGSKPPLPNRDITRPRVQAPPRQQEPIGRPTGGLMANFRSRAPRTQDERPHPCPADATDLPISPTTTEPKQE